MPISLEKLKKELEEYSKKPLSAEKIKFTRGIIKSAREYAEYSKDEKSPACALKYEHHKAYVKNDISCTNNTVLTTEKLVVADDYAKEGRDKEVYALLGNALDMYSKIWIKDIGEGNHIIGPGSSDYTTKKDALSMYQAIKSRALRGAKRVMKKDINLAQDYVKLAEKTDEAAAKLGSYKHLPKK